MRFPLPFGRLVLAAVGVVVVMSCDNPPASPRFGNGISGGPTGTLPVTPVNPNSPDTSRPFVRIDTPATTGQLFNVGDSILVVTRVIDDRQLASMSLVGMKFTGNASLGTLQEIVRYSPITAPIGTAFRTGLTDTIIRRYLKAVTPIDSTVDSLVIIAIATDASGNADTTRRRVNLVTGPKVVIEAPLPSDSVSKVIPMSVRVHVTHPDGVSSITLHVTGELTWPTRLDTTITTTFSGTQRDVIVTANITIPANAPIAGRVTINASAIDVNRQPGSTAPIVVFVRAAGSSVPRVTQVVSPRLEVNDSVTVTATGDGIASIGFLILDSTGTVVLKRDSVLLAAPLTSNALARLPLNFTALDQGTRIFIASFAVDAAGTTGYSVATVTTAPQSNQALAFKDSALIVFGRTYPLPRPGIVGDIAVDESLGNVFLSNMSFNRLEVWQVASQSFYGPGVAVGAAPWGLTRAIAPDSLLVANSGGTNISKVFIGTNNAALITEDLNARVRTRTAPLFEVQESIDAATNKISIKVGNPLLFSNRPQYIGQISDRRIFFSTHPTSEAPKGMIHWLDPAQAFPDLRTIVNYKTADIPNYLVLDADSIFVRPALATSGFPDTLVIWDHPPGTTLPSDSVRKVNGVGAAVLAIQAKVGSDIVAIPRVDITSIGLTDTTFVAVSGDRNWIAFGDGNTAGAGNIFMASPGFFSPIFSQTDLTNNAAERIFGLALDSTGITVAAHGTQSYYASVDVPFHLRLQGMFSTFSTGAGIAFHPAARGTSTPPDERLAFVASDDGTIQIMDVAHYLSAGVLPIKQKLYGPLRVSRRFPSDPPEVILKLYGVATSGLVVIDVRATDFIPVP